MRLLLLAAVTSMLLACAQPTEPQQAVASAPEEPVEVPEAEADDEPEQPEPEEAPEPEPEPEPEPDPEPEPSQEPEPVEEEPEPEEPAEPEPSPWLEGWIYLVDAEDTVHYSHEEPGDQLRAAYYDMAAKWNRQEREGWPFRVEEG